ncbi:hypothetical protein [Brevundimonas faecalis]|uniref:hypothetical protein n=1 Tax=Brevundimonas faecalis TaxID=947378 RepID=UPI00366FDC0E
MTDAMTNITKEEFCDRFVTEMMKAAPIFDSTTDELLAYADEIAPSYWETEWQREDGPEACAQADISYWGE